MYSMFRCCSDRGGRDSIIKAWMYENNKMEHFSADTMTEGIPSTDASTRTQTHRQVNVLGVDRIRSRLGDPVNKAAS